MATDYTEILPSPKGKWQEDAEGNNQFYGTRLLLCTWGSRASLISDLYSDSGCTYPHADGTSKAIVRGIETVGWGKAIGSGNLMSYSHAVLTVHYSTKGPRLINNLYVDESLEPTMLEVPLNYTELQWYNSTANIALGANEKFTKNIPGLEHKLQVSRALSLPSDLFTYAGCVNASIKTCLTMPVWFGAETVLCCMPQVTSHQSYDSTLRYTYTYRHLINLNGWNKYWNTKTQEYERLLKLDGTTHYTYPVKW